jgi:hypothetical protein
MLAAEYQEKTWMRIFRGPIGMVALSPLTWPRSSQYCYYVFWWFVIIGTIMLGWFGIIRDCMMGWCGIIQDYEMWRFGILLRLVCFSNPWEAMVELYGNLRMRPFGYEVSLDLSKPWRWCRTVSILWENLYTSAKFIESIRIATSLEWADARMRHYD